MVDDPAGTAKPPVPEDPALDTSPANQKPKLRERVDQVRQRAAVLEGRAVDRFEQERKHRTWVEICWQAWLRMRQRGGPLLSGGLAIGSSCSCCLPRCSWWRSSARSRT